MNDAIRSKLLTTGRALDLIARLDSRCDDEIEAATKRAQERKALRREAYIRESENPAEVRKLLAARYG